MSLALLRYLAVTFGPSITAAARPAVTLLAVQLTVAALVRSQLASLSTEFGWLISAPAIVVVALIAGLETAARHDPDIAAITRDLQIDNLTGAFGTLTAALLFAALGLPESAATQMAGSAPDSGGLLSGVSEAVAHERSQTVQIAAIGGAVGINLGLTWLRAQLMRFLDDFELGRLWARLETGGVVGLLIVLPLLPLLALGFLTLFAVGLSALALAARTAAAAVDRRCRVDCQGCDYRVRAEASLCPECHTERTPSAEPTTGPAAALAALRR